MQLTLHRGTGGSERSERVGGENLNQPGANFIPWVSQDSLLVSGVEFYLFSMNENQKQEPVKLGYGGFCPTNPNMVIITVPQELVEQTIRPLLRKTLASAKVAMPYNGQSYVELYFE